MSAVGLGAGLETGGQALRLEPSSWSPGALDGAPGVLEVLTGPRRAELRLRLRLCPACRQGVL